jgi:hypothetical protein
MRTRNVMIPVIHDDETIVVDDETTLVDSATMVGIPVQVGRQLTQDFDLTLRHPAESRFFVLAGFMAGAPTDLIADSIAAGQECVTGSASLARRSNWIWIVNLSDPSVPIDRQIAAWLPIKER